MPGLLVELYSGHCCMYSCNDGGHGCILRWPPFYRCNGHFLNLAPRFRAIDPPDRPGLNLRLVVRVNNPICHQNEPKNVHYLPVVTPRMVLQDMPPTMISRFWDPSRGLARAPTAPPRFGRGANRQLVIWGYAGTCGLWLLSTRGTLYDPLPGPQATIAWGSQISQPLKRCIKLSTRPRGAVQAPKPPPSR